MSVDFLFSRFLTQFKNSSVEIGESDKLKSGEGGDGRIEKESLVGWILEAVISAMVVKYELKALAMAVGSVRRQLLAKRELIGKRFGLLLMASLRIDQVFLRLLALRLRALAK
jgi:hypothetical protein